MKYWLMLGLCCCSVLLHAEQLNTATLVNQVAAVPELILDWKEGDANPDQAQLNGPWSKTKILPPLHHVIGVPLLKNMHPPADLKLSAKRELVCNSCHGLKKIEDLAFDKVDKKADDFLVGGPYLAVTEFCYRCHEKKGRERNNIHLMLDAKGDIKENNCKYCHSEVLKRDRVYKPQELKLRMSRETLCFGCHLKTPHLNAVEHQVKPSAEKLKNLQASEKKLGISLPLSDKGEVMCVTCHTPHPNGVLNPKLAAAKQVNNNDLKTGVSYKKHPWGEVYAEDKQARLDEYNQKNQTHLQLYYERISAEVLLRLPAKDGSLCMACHSFTDRAD